MADMTRDFINHPVNFLSGHPLIVSVSPDADVGTGPVHFKVVSSQSLRNLTASMLDNTPCELKHDVTGISPLTAYWCPYKADAATSLTVGDHANFMFTANMDGCTFASNGTGLQTHIVSHVNAGSIAAKINEYVGNQFASSLAQKAIQQHMAASIVGEGSRKIEHSYSGFCTTVVGVRDITVGSWTFYKQINSMNSLGNMVTVRSTSLI